VSLFLIFRHFHLFYSNIKEIIILLIEITILVILNVWILV